MSDSSTAYTFTLMFDQPIDPSMVTPVDFTVTSVPAPEHPLPINKMPPSINVNDTLTFTYQKANPGVKIKSCLLTRFNVDSSTTETDEDFLSDFDQPIKVTQDFVGSWIFHLLGMYKSSDQKAAFYLDPEATFKNG